MRASEVYGMLEWINKMRGSIDRAIVEFESRVEALLEEDE